MAKQLILRPLMAGYSAVLSIGDNNERYLSRYGVPVRKVFRSPLPIDEEIYRAASADRARRRRSYRRRLSIPDEAFVVVSVGKLSGRKGDRILLRRLNFWAVAIIGAPRSTSYLQEMENFATL